ncbi:chaperonin 10-like protein [Mariannaea sp. PMI_226]|nr:chaperonin 10-like protein [Mariannaea sp. PMI_226]
MALQTGIVVKGPNEPFVVVNDLKRQTPGPKQALVKSLAVGINPIEYLQQHTGLLVEEWPAVLGSDCVGVVLNVDAACTKLKPGDYVYGCAPIGQNKFTPFQETFLVEEDVMFKRPANISIEECCTIGVGLLTSALALIPGLELKLPKAGTQASEKDEWIVVLGGTGNVGQFAVQLAKLCGYKVLASGSPSKDSISIRNGATATFNGRGSVEEQVNSIREMTGGNFASIYDSTTYGYEVMVKALETCSTAANKKLASVDDWSEFKTPPSIKEYRVQLAHVCRRHEPIGVQVTKDIVDMIPNLEAHIALGTLRPVEYIANGVGWEKVIEGIHDLENGKISKKIVVRVQNE